MLAANYELEVDTENPIVKEYENEEELIEDLVHYKFSILPVIGKGVTITDVETESFAVIE